MQFGVGGRVFGDFKERLEYVWTSVLMPIACNLLRTTSSKVSTCPVALYTSYKRGTWMSHRTLCESSLLLMTHLASLSHSLTLLYGQLTLNTSRHIDSPSVNRQTPFRVLVLALFQIGNQLLTSDHIP